MFGSHMALRNQSTRFTSTKKNPDWVIGTISRHLIVIFPWVLSSSSNCSASAKVSPHDVAEQGVTYHITTRITIACLSVETSRSSVRFSKIIGVRPTMNPVSRKRKLLSRPRSKRIVFSSDMKIMYCTVGNADLPESSHIFGRTVNDAVPLHIEHRTVLLPFLVLLTTL